MNDPRLTIGYSTLGERARGIHLPAPRPDADILIVVQGVTSSVPERHDVTVMHLDSRGVSKSRNKVLDDTGNEFLLFGDDDVVWHEDGIDAVRAEFVANPTLALVLARAVDETGVLRKRYPARRARLTRWNSARAATYEIMLRPAAFRAAGVRFDENFGAGTRNYLGDEYILIADAVASGMRCEFVPITIASHPSDSSGARFGTIQDARARSQVFARVFGRVAPLVRLGFVLRTPSRFASMRLAARFVLGAFPSPSRGRLVPAPHHARSAPGTARPRPGGSRRELARSGQGHAAPISAHPAH